MLGPRLGSGYGDNGSCPHTSWGSCRPRKREKPGPGPTLPSPHWTRPEPHNRPAVLGWWRQALSTHEKRSTRNSLDRYREQGLDSKPWFQSQLCPFPCFAHGDDSCKARKGTGDSPEAWAQGDLCQSHAARGAPTPQAPGQAGTPHPAQLGTGTCSRLTASHGGLQSLCVGALGLARVSSHWGAQGSPCLPWGPLRLRDNLPFSSKAYTAVCPTDTCFSLCLGGDGMWYQQSPAAQGGT